MNICAGILAGGKSERMGRNKAFLPYGKEQFLTHLAGELSVFSEIIISVDDISSYEKLPYRLVPDEMQNFGPVEGIYQILKASKCKFCIIVATDMQYIKRQQIEKLAMLTDENYDCIVTRYNGLVEPLCSIYSKNCIPILEKMRKDGLHRIRAMYDEVRVKYVDIESLEIDGDIIKNINTEDDYRLLCEKINCGRNKSEAY